MASAPQRHVLRLDLGHAADQQHVLVAVSPADDADHSLDLELLATDNTKVYVMTRMFHSYHHITISSSPIPHSLCLSM